MKNDTTWSSGRWGVLSLMASKHLLIVDIENLRDNSDSFTASFTKNHAHSVLKIYRMIEKTKAHQGLITCAENRVFHVCDLGTLADGETLNYRLIIDRNCGRMIQYNDLRLEAPDGNGFC